jgi:hypothetical protein
VLDQRGELLKAALGFAGLPLLHAWLRRQLEGLGKEEP